MRNILQICHVLMNLQPYQRQCKLGSTSHSKQDRTRFSSSNLQIIVFYYSLGILQRVIDVIVNCVPYALFEVVANIFGLLFIVFRIKQKIITNMDPCLGEIQWCSTSEWWLRCLSVVSCQMSVVSCQNELRFKIRIIYC